MNDNEQYFQLFYDESTENLQTLNQKVLELENNPDNPQEIIDSMFRAAHTLKGMAGTMGFKILARLAHEIETLMDALRKEKIDIENDVFDLLFIGFDYIDEIITNIKNNSQNDIDISEYLRNIRALIDGKGTEVKKENKSPKRGENLSQLKISNDEIKKLRSNLKETDNVYKLIVSLDKDSIFLDIRGYMVLKKVSEIGYVFKSIPDKEKLKNDDISPNEINIILVSKLSINDIKREIIGITDVIDIKHEKVIIHITKKEKNENKSKSSEELIVSPTVRVDISKLDQLMNMVGELLINKTRLESIDISNTAYKDIISQLDRVTLDLHHIVMKIRMVPLAPTFNRFPRMIRDLSKEMNKKVDFIINGQNTELDRSIIDELSEPIVHLLRNAIDHGIETPIVREKADKNRVGTILLNAYQQGSEIIIEIEDDGKGINPELLVKTAVQNDIITSQEAEEMFLKDKLNLIFEPGLSTKKAVSDISGRGVGLDVVKNIIEDLDGEITIESEAGIGSKFTISLPLTMAITEALIVKIHNEIFAIPLSCINETLQIELHEIKQIKGQDVIVIRNRTLPLVDSREKLSLNVEYGIYKEKEKVSIVIINSGDKQIGLVVDDLLYQQEIVVKSLSDYFNNIKYISGATIIGDGDVALILDVRNIA